MTPSLWLGIDFGTSSVKVLVVTSDGVVVRRERATYETSHPGPDTAEQDPADYLAALAAALAACGSVVAQVAGIGLVGQTPTCVFVDSAGAAVRPALTWQDARATAEAAELAARLGDARPLTGMELPWAPSYPPAKLLWLSRHEPGTVKRTRWVLQPKEFAGLHLTGVAGCDPWSAKGLTNVLELAPAAALLEAVGWGTHVVPPIAPAWSVLGDVTPGAAAAFGLRAGTPVTVGWSDALGGMLAVGAFDGPTGFVLSGTSDIVGLSHDGGDIRAAGLLTIPSTCAPLPVVYGPTQASGASLAWLAGVVGRTPDELVDLAVEGLGKDGAPTFVPYISGERAPVWRPDARGLFLGLEAHHGPSDLAGAVLSGVGMSARHVLEAAEAATGGRTETVMIAGRNAAADGWRAMRTRTLGRTVHLLEEPDASALGAAMLAIMAVGGDGDDAARLRGPVEVLDPLPDEVAAAGDAFDQYLRASRASLEWTP